MPVDFHGFEELSGVVFSDKSLLKQAFTHRSYLNEHRRLKLGHNERLEFLGDAVLELATTEFLYGKYPNETEGELTAYRSALVNATTLSDVASGLSMDKFLLLSKGEAKDKGRARESILANTFEAVVGAIFIDQGYTVAYAFIQKNLFPLIDEIVRKKLWLDAKSHFQEKAQEEIGVTPAYRLVKELGPDHDKMFTVAVYLDSVEIAVGQGKSKQEAEQSAARNALDLKKW